MKNYFNPYHKLQATARKFADAVYAPKQVTVCVYPKKELHQGWRLDDLYSKVAISEQLGYTVTLIATDTGLVVQCREKPLRPWQF